MVDKRKNKPTEEISESDFKLRVQEDVQEAVEEIEKSQLGLSNTWKRAADLVKDFEPVPWLMWKIIHQVYGVTGEPKRASPAIFFPLDRLIYHAVADRTLGKDSHDDQEITKINVSRAVNIMGADVAASICFIYGVCRRVSTKLPERVWQPLLDDALLRAKLGYFIGGVSGKFGQGRGLLAGFAGRSGLTILIASGSIEQAQRALTSMAQGVDIKEVGLSVYGCEPLQISALALTAAGCNRQAAFGTASFGIALKKNDLNLNDEGLQWRAAFAAAEHIRMGTREAIEQSEWERLGYASIDGSREELLKECRLVQRRGHDWQWLTWTQLMMEKS